MAEFGVNDNRELPRPRPPPPPHPSSTGGDTPVAGDEGAGETVLNGDCRGISANMVGSGSVAVPATSTGSQAGLEAAANTSDGMEGKSGIPRRSSIIKVGSGGVLLTVLCWI